MLLTTSKLILSTLLLSSSILYGHEHGKKIPIDSNLELSKEKNFLYYADPRVEEGGKNRVLRINYKNMSYEEIPVDGINPHSIDRAGKSNKFYVRTQNSFSFDVVNFKKDTVKTIPLEDHKPRAIGAHNAKYRIQLLSALDMPIVDIINTKKDKILKTVGDRHTFNPSDIQANGGGAATGHAIWLTKKYFALLDRVHSEIQLYKVVKRNGKLEVHKTDTLKMPTAVHAIERVENAQGKDRITFYAMGEGDGSRIAPFVAKLVLQKARGKKEGKLISSIHYLSESTVTKKGIKPTTHHAGISSDKKYLVVPVYDGKIYIIKRSSMRTVKVIDTQLLGAGHIAFSASRNLGIITNHYSDKITILDMKTLTVKKYLKISDHKLDPLNRHLLQPHFSHISKNGKYFYTFATQDGKFLKINLDTLEIEDELFTGGAPEQSHS